MPNVSPTFRGDPITKTAIIKAGCSIGRALAALRRGGTIIYPTETSYGIGADWTNARACSRVYRIKQRPKEKLLSAIVGSSHIAKKYVTLDAAALRLVKRFMPGPLTLVSPTKGGKQSLAWRIPGHWLALELAKRFGKPIVATSANISGQPPLHKFEDVKRTFYGKVDVIIDARNLPRRTPSTIYDVSTGKVLRKGPISKAAILAALRGMKRRR
ncbi:MAG: L-threonylcarbamoyladenylate synthase [Candidatus Aenigmatarchaeota archaeon]